MFIHLSYFGANYIVENCLPGNKSVSHHNRIILQVADETGERKKPHTGISGHISFVSEGVQRV